MSEPESVDVVNTPGIIRDANELASRQNAAIRTQPEALEFIIRPQAMANSEYHAYLSKNLSLTNLTREDIPICLLFADIVNLGIYMEKMGIVTDDIPLEFATSFETWINAKRAEGMRTFTAIAEQTLTLKKVEEQKPTLTGRLQGK